MWSAIALFAVEFVGLFSGLSMFASGYNTLSTALHFTGMVLVGHFVNQVRHRRGRKALPAARPAFARGARGLTRRPQPWRLDSFNYLFGFFSVLPSVMEAGLAAAFFRFKSRPYLPPQ